MNCPVFGEYYIAMEPGFTNFQRIFKGQVLAKNNKGDVLSPVDGNIFMPLYQKQGNDGFFIVQPVEKEVLATN